MEGGPNPADQNFYARRPSSTVNSLHQHQHQHQFPPASNNHSKSTTSPELSQLRLQQRTYEPPPLPDFDARSPIAQLPPKLPFLTTANLHAAAANGYADGLTTGGGDPAEFYRDYRGVQQSPNGYTDTTNGMATTDSRPAPSSLRSNGNGNTPKHPQIPARGIKNSYRSVSSPLDERTPLSSAKSSPQLNGMPRNVSVKDMLKKFDQNLEGTTARKPSPRMGTKDGASTPGYMRDRTGYVGRTTGNSQNTSSTSRAGMSTREPAGRKSPEKTRTTQRTRFATEDQHSNNTLSGVPRSTRPRNSVSNTSQASKSMTNLSPTSPKPNSSQTPARRPLFGEVLPIGPGSGDIGYGIPNAATRRTSDSNLHPSWQRQRSRSEVDVSPSSPTAWYLGVTPALDDVDPNKPPRSVHGHNRNHSDFQDTKVNTMNGVSPSFESPVIPSLPKPPTSQTPQSRLPISSKRLSNSSESSSPTSTRASSPFTAKPYSNVKLRKSEQRPWSPASRDSNRSNTPIQTRGKARKPEQPPTGTVLAHISSPPLQASPPLRGSRTRQPVSSASTNSSRQKAVDRAGSPQHVRTGMKVTRNNGPPGFDDPPPRTIPDNAPVDWEAKKTKIRRAYTKSIHESEQRQIRADNLRRLNERAARDSLEAAGKESSATQLRPETPPPPVPTIDPQIELRTPQQAMQSSPPPLQTSPQPLQVNTTFFKDDQSPLERNKMTFEDSPTLGMPGTFIVDDDEPPSAISNATGITEIENEPQTEAARLRRLPSTKRKEPSRLSSNVISWTDDMLSPEQALYGMAHDESIDVRVAAAPGEKTEPTPTKDVRDPSPPGAFQEDPDDQPVFATTLTSASPEETSPAPSRPLTMFESGDEQGSSNVELPEKATPPVESLPEFQNPPDIAFPDEGAYSSVPDSVDGPRLQLPDFRTALAPSSVASNDGATDYLNTPVTDMEYDSSDGAGAQNHSEQEVYEASYDITRDPVPSSRGHRSSHQSSWTDYSLDSQGYSEHGIHSKAPPVTISDADQSSRQHSQSPTPPVPPKPEGYSPQPSPRFSATSPQGASPSRHQLPPLTTGDGFGFGFAEQALPLWPDHSPPPIPDQSLEQSPVVPTRTPPLPGQQSRRPPSSIDQSSHNDTSQHPESRRPSDDLYSPRPSVSTPRSSTQISFEDAVKEVMSVPKAPALETEEEREAARLLEKRLTKRKRQLMELIDTESVYLKDMNVVEEIYKGTAEACPKLEAGDVRIIFRNTDKIVAFTTMFLDELRSAVSSVYTPRTPKYRGSKAGTPTTTASDRFSVAPSHNDEQTMEEKDLRTTVGACFNRHLKEVTVLYTEWLKNSDAATARLNTLMTDHSVQVWLNECNTVAKDLTSAWDIGSLLVKPFQRLTRYPLFLKDLQSTTSPDHPDMAALLSAFSAYDSMIRGINDMTARVKLVGDVIKGRKRKESNVRQGIGKVFGQKGAKREKDEKPDQAAARGEDDPEFTALKEKHNDNFLRMQVVLRDVQFHLRQCIAYVDTDLKYKSAMELVMRLSASPWPELESKWARFNMSMRDMGTVALDQHTAALQTQVIEPFEKLIQLYNPANLAMKKREKRRAEYEKILAAKTSGSKISEKEQTKLDQYEALTETLKSELPMLFEKTETIANLLLGHLVVINTRWYDVWQRKVSVVLEEKDIPKTLDDVVVTFNREFEFVERETQKLGIVNGSINTNLEKVSSAGKPSTDTTETRSKSTDTRKGRPSDLSSRSRGLSATSDRSPSLPTPDFAKRLSGSQFTFSPITATTPNVPQFSYQNQPYQNQPYQNQPYSTGHSRAGSGSPAMPDPRSVGRPSTSRSYTSDSGAMRMSNDYNTQPRRESGSTYTSSHHIDGPPISGSTRPYSGIFHSAMPLPDGPEDSARSSRASSRDRNVSGGYNVLYLAASLFEFNIEATKSEAGYPYLTYQAGEIFDVIGEKGELWLAKNQDDPREVVGWIWSKHFARLASD